MGTEVVNISLDEISESAVISPAGISNQVTDKCPSVIESGETTRDLWGPRLFVKTGESKELKESKEPGEVKKYKESTVNECPVTPPSEVFPFHQDTQTPEDLTPEDPKSTNHEESESPIKSPSNPADVGRVKTHLPASHLILRASEKRASGGNQSLNDRTTNGDRPAKINTIQTTDLPKKAKGSSIHKIRKPSDIATHSNMEDVSSPVSSTSASVRSFKPRTTVASAPVFRCTERAEKRKEYYAKLEEKHRALEAERLQAEARKKEEMEAALKEFRKNLVIKAKPVPSFYQEGPPPKVEIKKTPPTRAKSPKLTRRRSLNDATHGDNNGICHRMTRHSLDDNKEVARKLYNSSKTGNATSRSKLGSIPLKGSSFPSPSANVTEQDSVDISEAP